MPAIAKVVVEIALDREFDYRIPETLQVWLGSRVQVPFGHSTARGYVVGLAERSDRPDLKSIESLIGDRPLLDEKMLKLARWMSDYYAATIEQAIRTLLPCAIRRRGAGFKEQLGVEPAPDLPDDARVAVLLKGSPKQRDALALLKTRGRMRVADLAAELGCSVGIVRALEKKGLVKTGADIQPRNPMADRAYVPTGKLDLFPEQAKALELVKTAVETLKPSVILLHGVTGSGKTEVYMQAIRHALDRGQGVIVLVPEISLTPQTVERFHGRFGDAIAILHSHLSDGERHDEWYRIFDGKARIVIGARSALFAPVANLGLIVVDEEHDSSYKQSEAPRYNARDVAVMRGHMEPCAVLLGSASPSMESFFNVRRGKYALSELTHRVDHRAMPTMRIVDMRLAAGPDGRIPILSPELREAVRNRLDNAEQVILFLNRRGFATSLQCPKCGFVAMCGACSVALTYHRQDEILRCHVCGHASAVPGQCPECRDPAIKYAGLGTQRVETVIQALFPKARVRRMDSDTTRRRHSHEEILGEFRARRIDILIGTQMIAKGLHFPGVTLVGVINADTSLHMPDFRSSERTFQMLVQVAGRAGRGEIPGEVIVQTFSPTHVAIQMARRLDMAGFLDQEIEARKELRYPPISHLVCVTLEGESEARVKTTAETLVRGLQPRLGDRVILAGPMPAPLARAKGLYRYQVMLRAPSTLSMTGPLKEALRQLPRQAGLTVSVDVDALSLQ